ncbi:MAG: VWA domain-containing protein [Thermoanaerobaculaceae bacterium]|nr:VWA domain-containing protein [Thermoanaerobaculaceae bacterium]MDI9623057.1 VWA domain-containing protein [Acidobacteriota bacterium]NLH10562.1 VWA domain-containing protein [Holophagae bacterium]
MGWKNVRMPPGAAKAAWALMFGGLAVSAAVAQTPTPLPTYSAEVVVRRVMADVRVVDGKGQAIRGLTADNFRVFVDGLPALLDSVEWIEGTEPYAEGLAPEVAAQAGVEAAPKGRLVVFFFQAGFQGVRLTGHMRMKGRAVKVLEGLKPEDYVAVVSYDSHLKLRVDFTTSREIVKSAIHDAILSGKVDRLPPGEFPSLATHFDFRAAKEAGTPEKGLLVLAKALEKLPGNKSLVFFGWGLGTLSNRRVWMGADYARARYHLSNGRVSVYSIDVTDADYHTLEVGLERVAEDTGGFYVKTNNFPDQAVTRIEGALAGHYVLVFTSPTEERGDHSLAVTLVNAKGTVLGKFAFRD